ncbi:MAG: lipopolysaccharide biosynthesis protein [Methylomonas sp.]|uniref:lipopolysaccharide biosynthesis protein n=1 Tax=Methylomonas sp. TaxID=418 RepID=UPI0025FF376A|nr:lipopolysaccharide biosynthesis protein [Methylomonas sp.]MCK9607274.1 lipopolysaccharide biosynthesis protein [Methylomonas sp.]
MQRLQCPGDYPKWVDSHSSSSEFIELLNPNFSVHPSNFSSLMLFGLSLCNYTLMYWANIFLAQHLSVNAFDDFNVAVSVVTLLSTFATLGLEKYALRLVALYMERENWPRLLGFWKFSLATILLFSFVLMGLTNVGLTIVLAWHNAESHTATLLYTLFLPAIALCLYLTEAITVFGAQILALVLYRLVLPTVFFLLIIVLHGSQAEMTAEAVMICLGSAWVLTLFMMLLAAHVASPKAINQVKADYHGKRWWLKNSLPLLLSSLMMTLLMTAGTILLATCHAPPTTVGIYAVAMKSSGFLALLGTSTNRYYLPMLIVLVERRDLTGINELLNKRTIFIGGLIMLFLCLISIWGLEILALFGPTFSKGYWTLLISSVGGAFMTLFSDSLYYLQFMNRNRLVIGLLSLAAISTLVLGYSLGSTYGATGMAIAYALPTITLFSSLKWLARRHMMQFIAG